MASNQHKNLKDANRHFPKGFETASNNTFLGKGNGSSYDDQEGALSWDYAYDCKILSFGSTTTAISVANNLDYINMPYKFRLLEVRASVFSSAEGMTTIDIKEDGVSILSTALTIDAGDTSSTTATTPVVISDFELADNSKITIDVTSIGDSETGAQGLKVYLIGYRQT